MENSAEKEINQVDSGKVVALPIWMGTRLLDYSDLQEFMHRFCYYRGFVSYNVQDLKDVDIRQMYGKNGYLSGVKNLFDGIKKIINEAEEKIAIFYIISASVAESKWFPILKKLVAKHAPNHPAYTIIVGGGFQKVRYPRDAEENPYSPYEIRAHELGAIYSYFNGDAPTAGMARLMEMMNRIMGVDLPRKEFPNYTEDELRQLAWHVCRESFNSFSPMEGAILKYKIGPNGRPMFNVRKGL